MQFFTIVYVLQKNIFKNADSWGKLVLRLFGICTILLQLAGRGSVDWLRWNFCNENLS
jgi:hypothetical protein